MDNNYLVSIRCMTYNQATYIKETMNGFCIQETSFPYVAIIVDDASTDGESNVIQDYLNLYFDIKKARKWDTEDATFIEAVHLTNKNCHFAAVLLKQNLHRQKFRKVALIRQWEGIAKYRATCEGDDYWIDPLKLQKQVDFLESHPDYGMVYTNFKLYYQEKGDSTIHNCIQTSFEDEIIRNRIATLTTLVRSSLLDQYIKDIGNTPNERGWMMGDYPTWIYVTANSKAKLISDVTAVYRVLKNSASHHTSFKKSMDFLLSTYDISSYFADKYKVSTEIRKTIAHNEINDLLILAYKHNTNLHFPLLKFMVKNEIFDIKKYLSAKLRSYVCGRKIYKHIKAV